MTKIARTRKIDSWECVQERISEITENVPEHTNAPSLPYGLQSLYTISHPEPVKILLHPSMNDYDTFVTHHGKAKKFYLNLWTVNYKDSSEKETVAQQKVQLNYQIKHIIYVATHRCFVGFATDLSLRVFATINFNEMSRVETSHSILCLFYNACRDDVLAGCLGFVMIWKFPQAQNACLVPTQRIDCPSIHPDYWVTWIKADKRSRQLLLNCEEAIVVLDERTYKLRYCFKISFRHNLPFSACAFYHPSCYFITGSKDYTVKVWNTSLKQCPLVTTFNGHCNAITALEVDTTHHLVISSSRDKTIRLWCLETLTQTFCLETGEEVHRMELMTSRRLFYQSDEHVRVWNLNHFHHLFAVLGFEIISSQRVKSSGSATRLLLQGADGAIRIVSPTDGTIITTMFPLETASESIVDYAYNLREEQLYVVSSSGAILVFNSRTNPCSAYEVWKSDDKVISVAMMNVKIESEDETVPMRYSLLFAGLANGQISLVYSNELTMNDCIEAHYGRVVLLRISQNSEHHANESPSPEYLVSSGIDCVLKIWKVVYPSSKIVSLEVWSLVILQSVPRDIAMIGNTIGLVMDDDSLMTCRVNSQVIRPRTKNAHRLSISSYDEYKTDCFKSVPEEKHSKSISGFSACPTLGLFATSSYDWSVKIWNTEAKLVKEICFAETLRGVCFANPRGDLLVGFQSHISIVPLTNYLPLNFLEMLSTMQFPDDVFEDNLPFDRMLSFSYHPDHTPCLPLDLQQRREILKEQEETLRLKPVFRIPSGLLLTDNEEATNDKETNVPPRRYSTTQEQEEIDQKLRRYQKSSLSRRSSTVQSPLLQEVIARITQSFGSRSELTMLSGQGFSSNALLEQMRKLFDGDEDAIPDDYWPCAPDGFIPNSVVRLRVPPKKIPAHLVPKLIRGNELKEWMEKIRKKSDAASKLPEDSFSPISIDDDLDFFSIFDGYVEPVISGESSEEKSIKKRKRIKLKKKINGAGEYEKEEEEEEESDSSEDEDDLAKKWKASKSPVRTTLNVSLVRKTLPRQNMKERRRVSKVPEMPMIAAEEEENEVPEKQEMTDQPKIFDQLKTPKGLRKRKEEEEKMEEEEPETETTKLLMNILRQSWFPKTDLSDITVESVYDRILDTMSNCAPLTYDKICAHILALQASLDISTDLKEKTVSILVDNLSHSSTTIRRSSLKAVRELNCKTKEAIGEILSCLNHKSLDLQNDAKNALEHLLGIKDKEALQDLFVTLGVLSPIPLSTRKDSVELSNVKENWRVNKDTFIDDWLTGYTIEQEIPEEKEEKVRETNDRNARVAASVLGKLKLYQKSSVQHTARGESRLSYVDLSFVSSPSTPPSWPSADRNIQHIEETSDFVRGLERTEAGYKLLTRMGFKRKFIGVPSRTHEEPEDDGNGPPTCLVGSACNKMIHEVDLGSLSGSVPEIFFSDVSSITQRSEEQPVNPNNLVLPKIYHHMKAHRYGLGNIGHRDSAGKTLKVIESKDARKMHYRYSNLPTDGLTEEPGYESGGEVDILDEIDEKSSPQPKRGKRILFDKTGTPIDGERRRLIIDGLRRRRKKVEEHQPSPLPPSEPSQRASSLVSLPRICESTQMSPRSVIHEGTQEITPEVHLPKINVHPKLLGTKNISSGTSLTSDSVKCSVGKTVRPVQYAYPYNNGITSGVLGGRLCNSLAVHLKKSETSSDNESIRVLPVDPKLTVDTGQHRYGRSRYGILEVLWTVMNVGRDNDELKGSLLQKDDHAKDITGEEPHRRRKSKHLKTAPMKLKREFKPIKNRNLVTNPYTNKLDDCLVARTHDDVRLETSSKHERVESVTPTNSFVVSGRCLTKSKQELKKEGICTFRDLLELKY